MAFFAHKKGVYFPLDKAKLLWISDDHLDAVDEPFECPGCQLESYKDRVEKLECGNFSEILNPTTMSRDTLYFGNEEIARKEAVPLTQEVLLRWSRGEANNQQS